MEALRKTSITIQLEALTAQGQSSPFVPCDRLKNNENPINVRNKCFSLNIIQIEI